MSDVARDKDHVGTREPRRRGVLRVGNLTTTRIEAFSDGVFAIVITLLVLELRVPQVRGADVSGELAAGLIALVPKFLSYVMSFLIVSIWWVAHHQFFDIVRRSDRGLLWLNNLFLLFLVLIPFPTALLGDYYRERAAVVFFGAVMIFAGFSFFLMRYYAARIARLIDPAIDEQLIRRSLFRSVMSPLLYATATLLAFVSTTVAVWLYAIIPVLYFVPGGLERHKPHMDQSSL